MMRILQLALVPLLAFSMPAHAQLRFRKVAVPAGETLKRALTASALVQQGAKPFHIRTEISQVKGAPRDYNAVIEETWVSPMLWVRTVVAPNFFQKTVQDSSGLHIEEKGDYFPIWVRKYVMALFDPVPEGLQKILSASPLEHSEFANGMRSSPCQRAEFELGDSRVKQINFASVCFQSSGGLLEVVVSPSYGMEFSDYQKFGNLRIARVMSGAGAYPGDELIGRISVLEPAEISTKDAFAVSPEASGANTLSSVTLPTDALLQLSGGIPAVKKPGGASGHGRFTVWVGIDRSGEVREVEILNSDDSGVASNMAKQLMGAHWKPYTQNGVAVPVEGALVISY